ncbi:hypothetical protein CES86_0941 [Brucella lupini]|uniref:Uncharacterized protein n=1 Tax=Brucella lupini TaxID=255457 RepID=A0A256GWU6_9HYPH|nr:hypothetical protein CES86_0941 [Brucella lupini]
MHLARKPLCSFRVALVAVLSPIAPHFTIISREWRDNG